jgi:hypothetical protein
MAYTNSDSDTVNDRKLSIGIHARLLNVNDREISIGKRVHLRHKSINININTCINACKSINACKTINACKSINARKSICEKQKITNSIKFKSTGIIDDNYKITLFDYSLIKYNNSYHTMINIDYFCTIPTNKYVKADNILIIYDHIENYDFIKIHNNIYKKIEYNQPCVYKNIIDNNDTSTYHVISISICYCIDLQNKFVKQMSDDKLMKLHILLHGTDENKKKIILFNKSCLNDYINKNNNQCCIHNCNTYKDYKYIHIILLYSSAEIYQYAIDNGMQIESLFPLPINYNL